MTENLRGFLNFIYFQRKEKGERKRGSKTSIGCLLFAPKWGPVV